MGPQAPSLGVSRVCRDMGPLSLIAEWLKLERTSGDDKLVQQKQGVPLKQGDVYRIDPAPSSSHFSMRWECPH